MSVVEQEIVEVVVLEPDETQKTLLAIKGFVEAGRWQRGAAGEGYASMCVGGMAAFLITGDTCDWPDGNPVFRALQSAAGLPPDFDISDYNNTREDEAAVLDWIDRAIALA
jgi:hypothetical protein